MDRLIDIDDAQQGSGTQRPLSAPSSAIPEASVREVHDWLARGEAILVDVREPEEIEEERVPGALLMPLSYFDADRFPRLPDVRLVLMCAFGRRSLAAAERLRAAGRGSAINMTGGIYAWKEAGLPLQS